MRKTIIVRSEDNLKYLFQFVTQNWRAMQEAGKPMAANLHEFSAKASDEQRAMMWLRLKDISEQAWFNGRQYSEKVWHEYFKELYLPEEDGPSELCLDGYKKWDYKPDGTRILVGSTERLTKMGKAMYTAQIEAFGASELGVRFSANPRDLE